MAKGRMAPMARQVETHGRQTRETYRALLVGAYIPYRLLAINTAVAVTLLVLGAWFFQKRVQRIIDIL